MHTDIATDSESRGKGKRWKKNIYRYGFYSDVDDRILKKKTPKRALYKDKMKLSIPKPPKELMQFQCTTSRKEDTVMAVESSSSLKKQST